MDSLRNGGDGMTAFDSKGERVENLAKVSRSELVQWIDGLALERNRLKRAADVVLMARKQAELKEWYEATLADLQREHVDAIERLPRVEAKLAQWREELERKQEDKSTRSVVRSSAEREAKVAQLIARIQAGDLKAAEELKGLI